MFKSIITQLIIIISIICLNNFRLFAQSETDFNFALQVNSVEEKFPAYYVEYAEQNINEIQLVLSGLFLFYKEFISSQDIGNCSFTPSCSEYALLAIKQQGAIIGGINFFDRFSRCHGLSPQHYLRHPKTHLLDDPIR